MPRKPEPQLNNKVRLLRGAVPGMTQASLAEEVGVTRQTIISLEAGGYVPSLPLALRIAKAFGEPVEKVFWLDE